LNCTLHLANIAALGHWLSILVIALVATAGSIGCNNGLGAVTAGGIGLAHWSLHWLQRPAVLAITMV